MSFYDRLGRSRHLLTTTSRSTGTITFTPVQGPAGRHTILAVVAQDGLVRRVLPVVRYFARPTRPGRAPHLRLTRRSGKLVITWGPARNAFRYLVAVQLADGRHLLFFQGASQRRVRVNGLLHQDTATASIIAINSSGTQGTPTRTKR